MTDTKRPDPAHAGDVGMPHDATLPAYLQTLTPLQRLQLNDSTLRGVQELRRSFARRDRDDAAV